MKQTYGRQASSLPHHHQMPVRWGSRCHKWGTPSQKGLPKKRQTMPPKDSFSMRPSSPQKTQHWLHPWMTIGTHCHDGNFRTSPTNKSTGQYKKWNHSKRAERERSQTQYWYMPEKTSFHTFPYSTKQLTPWITTHRNGHSQKQSSSKNQGNWTTHHHQHGNPSYSLTEWPGCSIAAKWKTLSQCVKNMTCYLQTTLAPDLDELWWTPYTCS